MPVAVANQTTVSPLAGQPATEDLRIDLARLEHEYFDRVPDLDDPRQMIRFGATGHRGSPLRGSFTESHILAITQAICDFRRRVQGTDGPLYLGRDTHALSGPAQRTALEVLAANGVETVIQQDDGVTPSPVISRAILVYNRGRKKGLADGVVITPSHNPPHDGGIRYCLPNGGPAGSNTTHWLEARANELLRGHNLGVKRMPTMAALLSPTTHDDDFVLPYVRDLKNVVDVNAIHASRLKLAVDTLGGTTTPYWETINSVYGLDIAIVSRTLDPTFSFIAVDRDGQIRTDSASPYAMARLVNRKDQYRLAFGNDPDAARNGIVTPGAGLIGADHYLAVAIQYLLTHRPKWPAEAAVGKSLVSSGLIDKIVRKLGCHLCEVPVGFQWFAPGLFEGSFCFGGEPSAGATFLRQDGTAWTTDKDGIVMNLLAAEINARTGRDPAELYRGLTAEFGKPYYARIDVPAAQEQIARLEKLSPAAVAESHLAGVPILAKLTRAPGNNAPAGGIKVVGASGWFAARPSTGKDIYKIYAETFQGDAHLELILGEAQEIVRNALNFTEEHDRAR